MSEITIPESTRLFIATPAYQGQVSAQFHQSMLRASYMLSKRVRHTTQIFAGAGAPQLARNVLVSQFMALGYTHLLFIDSDIEFDAEAIPRLLAASHVQDHDVCCAVYPLKKYPLAFPVNFTSDPVTVHPQTGYLQLRDACTGFMMIRRSVIERMMAAYPERKCEFRSPAPESEAPYEYNLFDFFIDDDGRYLSEDFGFSRLWQRIGGTIWADPNISLAHYGLHKYTGCLADVMEIQVDEAA